MRKGSAMDLIRLIKAKQSSKMKPPDVTSAHISDRGLEEIGTPYKRPTPQRN